MSKIDITVSLDSEAVEAAVRKIWAELFDKGHYAGGAGGAGVAAIRSQVLAFVQQMDFAEQIKKIAAAHIHGVLADVVQEVLRTEGRKQAKALVKAGTLIPVADERSTCTKSDPTAPNDS